MLQPIWPSASAFDWMARKIPSQVALADHLRWRS